MAHPAHAIALGFGSGLSPIAPGTMGTLWAWGVFLLLQSHITTAQIGIVIGVALPLGWWACAVTAKHLKQQDPGNIVWDEIVAFWLVLWLISPSSLAAQASAFALFRFFDAVKPGPVGWADKYYHGAGIRGAFGIMFDDLVAAFCTVFLFAVWTFMAQ